MSAHHKRAISRVQPAPAALCFALASFAIVVLPVAAPAVAGQSGYGGPRVHAPQSSGYMHRPSHQSIHRPGARPQPWAGHVTWRRPPHVLPPVAYGQPRYLPGHAHYRGVRLIAPPAQRAPQYVVGASSSSYAYSDGGTANTYVGGPVVYSGGQTAAPAYYAEPCAPPQIIQIQTQGRNGVIYNQPDAIPTQGASGCGVPQVVQYVIRQAEPVAMEPAPLRATPRYVPRYLPPAVPLRARF